MYMKNLTGARKSLEIRNRHSLRLVFNGDGVVLGVGVVRALST